MQVAHDGDIITEQVYSGSGIYIGLQKTVLLGPGIPVNSCSDIVMSGKGDLERIAELHYTVKQCSLVNTLMYFIIGRESNSHL